jgi:ComF family protein
LVRNCRNGVPTRCTARGIVVAVLAPPFCWGCGGLVQRGQPLCRRCRNRLHRLGPEPVTLCGQRIWAPVAYSGPARDLVRALKFHGATATAGAMAAHIAANAPRDLLPAGAVLVPVPLHPRRLRRRGYNQAALIAHALAKRTELVLADCLVRAGASATQVGRDRRERRLGPAGTIVTREEPPARVLLVDDVATTGATLAACAAVLRAAGCREVGAVTFARTLGR